MEYLAHVLLRLYVHRWPAFARIPRENVRNTARSSVGFKQDIDESKRGSPIALKFSICGESQLEPKVALQFQDRTIYTDTLCDLSQKTHVESPWYFEKTVNFTGVYEIRYLQVD